MNLSLTEKDNEGEKTMNFDNGEFVIVSRHPAAIQFIASAIDGEVRSNDPAFDGPVVLYVNQFGDNSFARIVAAANAEDVRGRIVYGNLPLHLAALAAEVRAIEFAGAPPRGLEYSLEDMVAAGAKIVAYKILDL